MHGIWLDPDEIRRLADRRATVVHNPASNCKLGSGLAPLRALVEAGVNVALGCDGTSSNDGVSILEAMKWATLLTGLTDPDYRHWLTPHEAFRMATAGGARSALWQEQLGALEPARESGLGQGRRQPREAVRHRCGRHGRLHCGVPPRAAGAAAPESRRRGRCSGAPTDKPRRWPLSPRTRRPRPCAGCRSTGGSLIRP